MNPLAAQEYYDASLGNPFLAAWISVLHEHNMPYATEVAPHDWEEAFEQFWSLGYMTDDQFNSVNFKKEFRRKRPPPSDISQALGRLVKEVQVAKPEFEVFSPAGLTKANPNGSIQRAGGFRQVPAAPTPGGVFATSPARMATPAVFAPIEPTRRTLASPSKGPQQPASIGVDPRTYVEDFAPKMICCNRELEMDYDDGRDITEEQGESSGPQLVEFVYHAVCEHCNTESHHSFIKPMPNDITWR